MDIRPELGRKNPDDGDLYRGYKDYSNSKYTWDMYGYSPEYYKEELERRQEEASRPTTRDWNGNPAGILERPKTQDELGWDSDYVEEWLDVNNRMAHDDPHSPIQRMNQPMGAFTTDWDWKNRDGDYAPSQSFAAALLDDKTGGSFKDTLNNQSDGERQEWLNQNHGGRGLGYMGQNAYQSNPNMDERRAAVQANAQRFFKSRGFKV